MGAETRFDNFRKVVKSNWGEPDLTIFEKLSNLTGGNQI